MEQIQDLTIELANHPHILKHIRNLEERLECQQNVIKNLTIELKNYKEKGLVDSATQTDSITIEKDSSTSQEWITGYGKEESERLSQQVAQVAECAVLQTGFAYEQTTGLYYHYDSGYYYDPKSKLYYDGNTGSYYNYNKESESYEIYRQITKESNSLGTDVLSGIKSDKNKKKIKSTSKNKSKLKKVKEKEVEKEEKERKKEEKEEEEEGQLPDSDSSEDESNQDCLSSSSSSSSSLSFCNNNEMERDDVDVAKIYPPCMRVIVKETNLPSLRIGSLFVVTYFGGTVGREGDHSIMIPDINVSKHHANIQYNGAKNVYEITDLGSRNGTWLNGARLSVAKKESEPSEIVHGSILQLGHTKLLCHVHKGHDTCGHCEPGLLRSEPVVEQTSIPIKSQHQEELKRLKMKFGVEGDNTKKASSLADGYQDRAQSRRENVGSSNHHYKTQQSSLEELIPKDNMGFKMLLKMGWTEGECLGKHGDGIKEPVPLQRIADTSEFSTKINIHAINGNKKKSIWKKTQQRFNDVKK